MMVADKLSMALEKLGYPVRRLAYTLKKGNALPDTYFVFQTITILPCGYADDDSTGTMYYFRVNLYAKGDYTGLLTDTLTALKEAGFTVSSVDAEIYEGDTGFYHIPISINILEG